MLYWWSRSEYVDNHTCTRSGWRWRFHVDERRRVLKRFQIVLLEVQEDKTMNHWSYLEIILILPYNQQDRSLSFNNNSGTWNIGVNNNECNNDDAIYHKSTNNNLSPSPDSDPTSLNVVTINNKKYGCSCHLTESHLYYCNFVSSSEESICDQKFTVWISVIIIITLFTVMWHWLTSHWQNFISIQQIILTFSWCFFF